MIRSRKLREKLKGNSLIYGGWGIVRRIGFEIAMLYKTISYYWSGEKHKYGLPLPPPKLRYWVHGQSDAGSFIEGGMNACQASLAIIEKYRDPAIGEPAFLDLGCGCARVLRHYFTNQVKFDYFGVDINASTINWNRKNLPDYATWEVNNPLPPLSYENSSFDIILANSLFTHLDEDYQLLWLREVARLLSATGIAVLTVHEIKHCLPEEVRESLDEATLRRGFYVHEINVGIRNFAGFPTYYQSTYHTREYIYEVWSKYFNIVAFIEKGIDNYQSAVVVNNPSPYSIDAQ